MRIELVLEPEFEIPDYPNYISHAVTSSRRVIAEVREHNVSEAIYWAKSLKEKGIVEEYLIGPTTLEDAYVRMVGRLDVLDTAGEKQ